MLERTKNDIYLTLLEIKYKLSHNNEPKPNVIKMYFLCLTQTYQKLTLS